MICYIQDIKLWITERIQSLRDVFAEGWVAAKKSHIIPLDQKSIHINMARKKTVMTIQQP